MFEDSGKKRGRPPKNKSPVSEKTHKVSDDNEHLLDLDNLLSQIVDSGLDPAVFDVELDIQFAKNVIEFALSPDYMNSTLWAKQAEQAVRLFAEYCPRCTDMEWFDDVPVDAALGLFRNKVQLLEHAVCPKCSRNKCELFENLPLELVSCLGQRAGKTALTGGIAAPYYVHKFLEIKNPTRFYGLMSNTLFQITFAAVTATQAYETLWSAFKGAIGSSPWFRAYIQQLREAERANDFEKGTLVKVIDSVVWFGNKQLGISYAAADMKSLRGRTRVFSAIDELGWMNAKDAKRANADETYAALSNSLRTVRSASDKLWAQGEYKTLPGIMANISSPSSQYDKIMRLLKEGERDKRKKCFHLASWEASPLITRESLSSEETNNPVVFWRDFGAVPPLANNPYIESERAIMGTQWTPPRAPLLKWKTKYIKDKISSSARYVGAELIGAISDARTRLMPRIITIDCGETQNSFAMGIFHLEAATDPEEGGSDFYVVLDALIEAKPERIQETEELIPVHFPTMFSIALGLSDRTKGLNIRCVLYDRWQSTGEVQRLRDLKIKAEKYSPKEQNFKDFRNLIYSGNFKTPTWEHSNLSDLDVTDIEAVRKAPYTNLAVQLATVREVGRKVIKPEVGDDDLFRTCVLASYYLTENKKEFLTLPVNAVTSTRASVGAVALRTSSNYIYRNSSSKSASAGAVRLRIRGR